MHYLSLTRKTGNTSASGCGTFYNWPVLFQTVTIMKEDKHRLRKAVSELKEIQKHASQFVM